MACKTCNGTNVMRDAWAVWDVATQSWVLGSVFDAGHCDDCGGETSIIEIEVTTDLQQITCPNGHTGPFTFAHNVPTYYEHVEVSTDDAPTIKVQSDGLVSEFGMAGEDRLLCFSEPCGGESFVPPEGWEIDWV